LAPVGAGVAYAASSALIGGRDGGNVQAASGYEPWLGIDLYNSPYGGPIVVAVAAGSPAQAAGVEPGDVISEIDGKRVATASEFASAVARKHAGDRVALQFERGTVTYVANIRLAARPVAQP
jgi:putative serine protease PepD